MKFINPMIAIAATIVTVLHSTQAETIAKTAVIPTEAALEAVQSVNKPAGLTFTGAVEMLQSPTTDSTTTNTEASTETQHESFRGHHGRHWGWGRYGGFGGYGFGGFGPYRFGYSCGGLTGWAYPLGYWNSFGVGLYGGGCGLGYALGDLFYC